MLCMMYGGKLFIFSLLVLILICDHGLHEEGRVFFSFFFFPERFDNNWTLLL